MAVVWALVVGDVINENDLAVIAPAILIAAGVIGLATSLASARNRRNRDDQPVDHPVDTPTDHRSTTRSTTRRPTDPAESPLDDHTKEIR